MASTDLRGRSSAEIQRETERTRAEIAATLDSIQARLSSAYWRDRARDGTLALEIVRRYPLPALMIGCGVLWLAVAILRGPGFRPRAVRPLPRDRAPARLEDFRAPPRRAVEGGTAAAAVAPAPARAADDELAARRAVAAGAGTRRF